MFNKFVFFPNNLGQLKKGVETTPKIMKYFLKNNHTFYELSDTQDLIINLNSLYKVNNSFEGKRINIGGDHSMSIATVAHSNNKYSNVKVIWVDAHADINTYASSLTKNYHGMPLSFLTGMVKDDRFPFIQNYLPFNNILYFGLRDLDHFEKFALTKYKIKAITMEDIIKDYNRCLGLVLDFIKDDYVHLSFDVDSMDPNVIPSTGTPVDKGLHLEEGKCLLDTLINKTKICNVDITELNLEIGSTNDRIKSLNNTFHLFDNYF
jgi:arginase